MAPLLIIGLSFLFGSIERADGAPGRRTRPSPWLPPRPISQILAAARERLNPGFGTRPLPTLVREAPAGDQAAQVRTLLRNPSKRILAVLTGDLDRPALTGAISNGGPVQRQMSLVVDQARQQRALAAAGRGPPPAGLKVVETDRSEGALAATRAITARAGQLLLFMLTVLLAGMLLSNLVEEKSNKVIEVLAAAVPIDAIFVGKLVAMLAVSLVGIAVWEAARSRASPSFPARPAACPSPPSAGRSSSCSCCSTTAPITCCSARFSSASASQANSVREVQTLSMPVTVGQMLIFLLASFAVGAFNSPLGIAAAIFPFSSPLTMVAGRLRPPSSGRICSRSPGRLCGCG